MHCATSIDHGRMREKVGTLMPDDCRLRLQATAAVTYSPSPSGRGQGEGQGEAGRTLAGPMPPHAEVNTAVDLRRAETAVYLSRPW
jgi:hypothetical protein